MVGVEVAIPNADSNGHNKDLSELKEQIQEIKKEMEEDQEGFKCLNKAMEIPLVSGLTSSVYATTEYISSTRPVSLVSEQIKTVGEREDVKNVLTSVTTLYENNMSQRVQDLRESLNPTLKNLDGYACTGIDMVNEKVSETKETYVDPMVNKINETRESYVKPVVDKVANMKEQTTKVVNDYTESAVNVKNTYVDPAIERATNATTNVKNAYVDPAIQKATDATANVKNTYVDPAIEKATNVKNNYVDPAIERANSVKTNYVDPAITKAYSAVEDPQKAYGEVINYSKDVITTTKDVTINKALNTVDTAKEYLLKAKDTSIDQMQMYVNEARESVKISSRKSFEQAMAFARSTSDAYLKQTAELMMAAQAAAYEKLHTRYPTIADLIDRGITSLTTTTQIVFQATKTTVTVTIDSTRNVAEKVGNGVNWTKESYSATKEAIVDTSDKVVEYRNEFTKSNEENIRYLANIAGLTSYLGAFIALYLALVCLY